MINTNETVDNEIGAKNIDEGNSESMPRSDESTSKPKISDAELSNLKEFYKFSKSAAIGSVVCFVLFFLIVPVLVGFVIEIVWCIKCLTLKNDELRQDCTLWGILGLILLPIVPIFIMKSKTLQVIQKYDSNFPNKKSDK